jgi:hypothetical protein
VIIQIVIKTESNLIYHKKKLKDEIKNKMIKLKKQKISSSDFLYNLSLKLNHVRINLM